jgi:hypothetical protein
VARRCRERNETLISDLSAIGALFGDSLAADQALAKSALAKKGRYV